MEEVDLEEATEGEQLRQVELDGANPAHRVLVPLRVVRRSVEGHVDPAEHLVEGDEDLGLGPVPHEGGLGRGQQLGQLGVPRLGPLGDLAALCGTVRLGCGELCALALAPAAQQSQRHRAQQQQANYPVPEIGVSRVALLPGPRP